MRSTLRGTTLTPQPTTETLAPARPPAAAPGAGPGAAAQAQEAPTEEQRQADVHAHRSQAGMARERRLSQWSAHVQDVPVQPGRAQSQATAQAPAASLAGLPSELQRNVARYGTDQEVNRLSLANQALAASTHPVRLMRAIEHQPYVTVMRAARSIRQQPLENRGPAFSRCLAEANRFSPPQQTTLYRELARQLGGTVNAEPWHDAATRDLYNAITASHLPPTDRDSLIQDALRPSRERRGIYF